MSRKYSEYIVYVDESGDHGLANIDPQYPIFVLAFCIFKKKTYIEQVVPALQQLKFKHFGHDMVVFHEVDIRKSRGDFDFLLNAERRETFLKELTTLLRNAEFTLLASCIHKQAFSERRKDGNVYHVAMEFGLERIFYEMQSKRQHKRKTHVVFERRGKKEDAELELEFRRILDHSKAKGIGDALELVMASKKVNSSGLQVADMVARPVGRHLLNPGQENRAYEVLRKKFRRNKRGEIEGWGLKCYP